MSATTTTTNNNNNNTAAAPKTTLSIHDPEFKNLITVPMSAVHHVPPAHLEISRLVLCRKYDPRDSRSCPMADSCKFVHIDMSTPELQVQSIHVNYAYRSLAEVKHPRLPAGETLAVMAPNNRAPSQLVPSEMIIATRGALQRNSGKAQPLSHCAHYFYNRMCNRGDRCGFIHALYIDENATEFQRAPPRAGASCTVSAAAPQQQQQRPAVVAEQQQVSVRVSLPGLNTAATKSVSSRASSNDLSESPRSQTGSTSRRSSSSSKSTRTYYRHNPYSLIETTLNVEMV